MDREKALQIGLEFMECIKDEEVNRDFLYALPLSFVKKNLVFPLSLRGGTLRVALADLSSLYVIDDIGMIFSVQVSPVISTPKEILAAIHRHYERSDGTAQDVVSEISSEGLDTIAHRWEEPRDLIDFSDESPVIRLLNSLFFQAVKEKASDIHIEPYEREIEVRFRRDGVLYSVISPPKLVQDAIVSRVKIMAGLNIAEKRLPQDGRIRLLIAGKDIDIRVSIVPTAFGERVALRVLDRMSGVVNLASLGLSGQDIEVIDEILFRANGILLVTGPTGSGKTTTLYGCLNKIDTRQRNVITIEDPVEYQLKGIGQIQINTKIGITFASGLKSILRQDPDIIMVGEIRDPETAQMAIQASLTGHLVLSTLHTSSTSSAAVRLVDLGVEPFLMSSSLSAVIAQRLVRVLCECRQEYLPSDKEMSYFKEPPESLWMAKGCPKCYNTGYHGQTGVFELMRIDQEMRQCILRNIDSIAIRDLSLSKGMRTIKDDGLQKAAGGITSLEEVIRISSSE